MIESALLEQLHQLVGKQIEYLGNACSVIEVLDTEGALVVRCDGPARVIQGNQFGEATRRVQQCHTLSLFDDNSQLNPVIKHWLETMASR